jgi:plasmid maintenance system antidote protein VapI
MDAPAHPGLAIQQLIDERHIAEKTIAFAGVSIRALRTVIAGEADLPVDDVSFIRRLAQALRCEPRHLLTLQSDYDDAFAEHTMSADALAEREQQLQVRLSNQRKADVARDKHRLRDAV